MQKCFNTKAVEKISIQHFVFLVLTLQDYLKRILQLQQSCFLVSCPMTSVSPFLTLNRNTNRPNPTPPPKFNLSSLQLSPQDSMKNQSKDRRKAVPAPTYDESRPALLPKFCYALLSALQTPISSAGCRTQRQIISTAGWGVSPILPTTLPCTPPTACNAKELNSLPWVVFDMATMALACVHLQLLPLQLKQLGGGGSSKAQGFTTLPTSCVNKLWPRK